MVKAPTMTLHECCEAMRANQISISENTLAQMIKDGKLPFAVGVEMRQVTVMIFRKAFYEWLGTRVDNMVEI